MSWLATNPKTRKPEQIRRDGRVALFYLNPSANEYVAILGEAQIVEDPAEKARRWKDGSDIDFLNSFCGTKDSKLIFCN